jgi:hypothetical protein
VDDHEELVYAPAVSARIRVLMAHGPDDRPKPFVMLGLLAALSVIGFTVTRATFEHDRSEDDGSAPAEAQAVETPAQGQPAPAPPAPAAAAPEAPAAVAVEDASLAAPAVAAEPAPAGDAPGALTRGRIAYIRCDGMPQLAGPNPCPRDQAIERAVWTAIERLPACAALLGKRGASDVRVVFDAGTLAGLGFRDLDTPELDRDAVRGCLEPSLTGLRTTRPGARITASFRFDIE